MALGFVNMNIYVKKARCRHMCMILRVCTYKKHGHGLCDMGLCVTRVSWELGLQSLGMKASPLVRHALFGNRFNLHVFSAPSPVPGHPKVLFGYCHRHCLGDKLGCLEQVAHLGCERRLDLSEASPDLGGKYSQPHRTSSEQTVEAVPSELRTRQPRAPDRHVGAAGSRGRRTLRGFWSHR